MNWLSKFSRKVKVITGVTVVTALVFAILSGVAAYIREIPDSQHLAERWSADGGYTQLSVFYGREGQPDPMMFKSFEYTLADKFTTDGITAPTENARLWVSAYSGSGKIRVTSGKTTIEAAAVGVGGDFFLFHPFKLLYGSYFSGSDLMQDGIIIDEDAAWQLFGSSDVAGMTVSIGGVPHYIAGVIRREAGLMDKKAGMDQMTVYLSYESLRSYGSTDGISCYEVLLPNPVSGYGKQLVTEKLGVDENTAVLMENSERYSPESLLTVLADFGARSMQTKSIIWPGWENAARGLEDVLALLLVFQIICVSILAVITVIVFWEVRKLIGKRLEMRKRNMRWGYEETAETMDQ